MHFLSAMLILLAMQSPIDDRADVAAIKERYMRQVIEPTKHGSRTSYIEDSRWTCKDRQRALVVSVDGSLHWCHKVQF
jgi:hypothetical protein